MASSFVYTGIPLNLMHNNNHNNNKKYIRNDFFFFFFFFWFVDCCFWFTPVDFLCIQGEQLQSDFIFSTLCTPPKFSFLFFYHFFFKEGGRERDWNRSQRPAVQFSSWFWEQKNKTKTTVGCQGPDVSACSSVRLNAIILWNTTLKSFP